MKKLSLSLLITASLMVTACTSTAPNYQYKRYYYSPGYVKSVTVCNKFTGRCATRYKRGYYYRY